MEGILELVTPSPEEAWKELANSKGFEETVIKAENCQPCKIDKYFKEEREMTCVSDAGNSIKGGETELAVGVTSVILGFSLKPFRKI